MRLEQALKLLNDAPIALPDFQHLKQRVEKALAEAHALRPSRAAP